MKNFINSDDITDYKKIVEEAIQLKNNRNQLNNIGKNKSIGLLFFNSSLRTRMSTQKASMILGLKTFVMNFNSEGWQLEFENSTIMSEDKAEHVKDAAKVMSQYCDIIGIRKFADLNNKIDDEKEIVLTSFIKYSNVPILNLESSTFHPLQSYVELSRNRNNNILFFFHLLQEQQIPLPSPLINLLKLIQYKTIKYMLIY